ncbi:thioredoxin [Streptomyces sp. NPDC008222]|uniref:thioredoxin n=1 Tax=Streptomyces sp. NPDC008222 TaxID=3364820 RepID=UPI0036E4D76B
MTNTRPNSPGKDVTAATFQTEVINADKTVLVDFWAPWCGPCLTYSPILDQIAAEHADQLTLVKVNVDENPVTAEEHHITGIPTVVLYRNGEIQETIIGAMPKTALQERLALFLHE